MFRKVFGALLCSVLVLASAELFAAVPGQASADDLLLTSTRIDNYSLIVPKAKEWTALSSAPQSASCAQQLWKLFVDKDFVERPYASKAGDWALGILSGSGTKAKATEWATTNPVPNTGILVTQDFVLCSPTVDGAKTLGVMVVGKRDGEAKKEESKESILPTGLPLPGDMGFMQGFMVALKFWQEAPSTDNVTYAAGRYAGTAVLIIVAGIVALFLVMFIIKKTIKTAFVLAFKILFWPICCLFRRKKKEAE